MATIENFILRFKVEGANALAALKDDIKDLTANANPLGGALGNLTSRLGLLGGAALAGAGAFAALGMRAINLADNLQDLSDATGIGADQLLNLKQSMAAAGGSTDSFAKASTRLAVSIGEAMGGNDKYQKSFKDLGVFVTDAAGQVRDSGDILQDVVGKLAAIEDPALRAAKAVELMGKEAAKVDWSKVSAGRDAVTADQIAQLAKYQDEIDKFSNTVENKLVTSFGGLAQTMNQFFKEYDSQGFDAFLSRLQVASLRMSGFGEEANKLRAQFNAKVKADQQATADAAAETTRLLKRSQAGNAPAEGGYGPLSEAKLKALADSQTRIEQSRLELKKQNELAAANEIQKIGISADYEAQQARAEILAKGRALGLNFASEAAAKEAEIFAKRDKDIAQARQQLNAKIYSEEERQRQQTADETAAATLKAESAAAQARSQVDSIRQQSEELQGRFELQQRIVDLGTLEQERQTKLFDLEQQRKRQLEAIAKIPNIQEPDKLKQQQELNAEYAKTVDLINKEADARRARDQDFSAGFTETMKRYSESLSPLKQGAALAESVYSNMGSSLDRFVETGKFKFGDFAKSVIQDLLKIQLRAAATQLFNSVFGSFFGLPGKALGGPVMAGQPYIVGERGPELFMPASAGNIVPNNKLSASSGSAVGGTSVIYNINAVDAPSFRQLLAKDPSFLYAVTEQGRKTIPSTRR